MAQTQQARDLARRLGVISHPTLEDLAEAIALFAPLGWAMCGRWHQAGTVRALQKAGNGATNSELDEVIAGAWNNENATMLKHAAAPIRRWSNSHYPLKQKIWDRVNLIEKAIDHHFAGAYEASIPVLLAQIDGMSFDLTGQSFFSKKNSDPFLDDETIAGMETNLPVVRALFSEDIKVTANHAKISRHGIMHGRDLAYATYVNSTKTIVLVAALAEYFPKIADNKGILLRREHEDHVAGSVEVDGIGRLVDDRHIPELLNFAYDLNSEYLKSVLLDLAPFDVSRQVASVAEMHCLDTEAFTLNEDETGFSWHYTTPAGQTLGESLSVV